MARAGSAPLVVAGAVSAKPATGLAATAADSAAHFQEEAEGPAALRMDQPAAAGVAFAASIRGGAVPRAEMAAAWAVLAAPAAAAALAAMEAGAGLPI